MADPSPNKRVTEIVRCGKDPVYFIRSYCRIQHPTRGTIPFETYPFQDDCVEQFQKNRLNIILKSRQLGLSTICAAYVVWFAIFHKDKNVLVIATKLETAKNFLKKVKVILKMLPPWLLLTGYNPTLQSVVFSNGSQITAIPTSPDAGRSEALSLLVIDEAAWIKDFSEIWTGLSPTISTGGNAIILSTPNGVGGQYYRLWTEAESGSNDFNPIRLPWNVHPEHDQAWFDKETKNLSKKLRAQEYLCDFISSGDTFLAPEVLEELRVAIMDPDSKEGHDRNVWVWSQSVPGHRYVISADISRGNAKDYSTFHIIDINDYEVAAEYMGKVPPEKLADMLAEWGRRYNNALIAPENNTYGYLVVTKLRDTLSYNRLYYSSNKGDPFNYTPKDDNEVPGFPTNAKTRLPMIVKLEELIRRKVIKTYSRRLYDQLQAFVWNGNKPQASNDANDDLVVSLAIGCWIAVDAGAVGFAPSEMTKALLNAAGLHSKDITHLPGDINDVQPLVNPNIKGLNAHSVYRPRDASQTSPRNPYYRVVSDYSWLTR